MYLPAGMNDPLEDIDFESEDFQLHPYPYYDALRTNYPVCYSARYRQYFIFSAEHVREVLRRRTFTVNSPFRASRLLFGPTVMDVDGSEHKRLRETLNTCFVPARYPNYTATIIQPVVHSIIDRFHARGEADFICDFANLIPVMVMSRIIGIPDTGFEFFRACSVPIIDYLDVANQENARRARQGLQELKTYLVDVVAEKKKHPDETVIGSLVAPQQTEKPLSDSEILTQICLLIPAAIDTTNRLIGNGMFLLCTFPALQEQLRQQQTLIPNFIEETMRYEPSIHSSVRVASEDCTLGRIAIHRGVLININFAAANRDPQVFPHPDQIDLQRPHIGQHFSFGGGRHQCMGRGLATVEVTTALSILLDRCHNLRFNPAEPMPAIKGTAFRSPSSLPLLFQPA